MQQQNTALNDVVVIGYGSRKKKDVTGAVTTVTSKDIEKSTSLSPELALQGTAAGVLVQSGGESLMQGQQSGYGGEYLWICRTVICGGWRSDI